MVFLIVVHCVWTFVRELSRQQKEFLASRTAVISILWRATGDHPRTAPNLCGSPYRFYCRAVIRWRVGMQLSLVNRRNARFFGRFAAILFKWCSNMAVDICLNRCALTCFIINAPNAEFVLSRNNAISKKNFGNFHAFWKLSLPIRNRIVTSAVIVKR
jgi:hypothetical protein